LKNGGDLFVQRSRIIFENPDEDEGFLGSVAKFNDYGYGDGTDQDSIKAAIQDESFLTLTNSQNYENRGKTVKGAVNFTTWAGDPFTTRTVKSNTMVVGPTGYLRDIPSDEE